MMPLLRLTYCLVSDQTIRLGGGPRFSGASLYSMISSDQNHAIIKITIKADDNGIYLSPPWNYAICHFHDLSPTESFSDEPVRMEHLSR